MKLLNSYQRLSAQNVKGENITSTLFNIAGMMHTVADAFEKQLDSLYAEEAMDISADITVFETLLKQEGFVAGRKAGGGQKINRRTVKGGDLAPGLSASSPRHFQRNSRNARAAVPL